MSDNRKGEEISRIVELFYPKQEPKLIGITIEQYEEYLKLKEQVKELELIKSIQSFRLDDIPKARIIEKLEQNKAKTDCTYCNNTCDSYAVCMFCKELLEEK